jgi:hypothetical protein
MADPVAPPALPDYANDPAFLDEIVKNNPAPDAAPPPPVPKASLPDYANDPVLLDEIVKNNPAPSATPKGEVPPPILGRIEHLNALQAQGNEAMGGLMDAVKPLFEAPGAGDAATLGEAAARLQKAGVDAYDAIRRPGQATAILVEADKATTMAMQALGIDKISANPEAVNKVRAGLQLATLLRHAPVTEAEATQLSGRIGREHLKAKMTAIQMELQGALAGDAAVSITVKENADRMQQLYNKTTQWTDDEWRNVMRLGLAHQINAEDRVAQNTWEENAGKEYRRNMADVLLGGGGSLHPNEVRSLSQLPAQRLLDPTHADVGRQAATVAAFLGQGWKQSMIDAYDNGRLEYNLNRAGWRTTPDGAPIPGQFSGISFVDMIPTDSLKTLLDEAAANQQSALTKQIQTEWEKDAYKTWAVYGAEKTREIQKQVADGNYLTALRYYTSVASLRRTIDDHELSFDELTPYMKTQMTPGNLFGAAFLNAQHEIGKVLQRGTTAVDAGLQKVPGVNDWAKTGTYAWTGNAILAETTKGPSHMMATVFQGLTLADGFKVVGARLADALKQYGITKDPIERRRVLDATELAKGTALEAYTPKTGDGPLPSITDKSLLHDLVGMEGASPERVRAAFDMEAHAGDFLLRNAFGQAVKEESDRQGYLSAQLDGKAPRDWLGTISATSKSLVGQMLLPVVDVAAALVDDPRQGIAYMIGFDMLGRSVSGLGAAKTQLVDRMLQGYGLQRKLVEMAKYAPEHLTPYRKAISDEILRYDPARPEVTLRKLEAAGAAIDHVLEDQKANRFVPAKARELGATVRKIWGNISGRLDESAESIAYKVGSESTIGNFFHHVDQAWGKLIQRPGKWFDFLSSRRILDETGQSIDRMMRSDTGLFVGPDTDDVLTGMRDDSYQKGVAEFKTKNGRDPTMREMLDLMPEQNRTLVAALNASDHLPPPGSSIWARAFLKLTGVRHPELFERVVRGAEKMVDAAHQYAVGAAQAQKEWRPVMARNDVIASTAEYIYRDRLESRLKPARAGAQASIDADMVAFGPEPTATQRALLDLKVRQRDELDATIRDYTEKLTQTQKYRSRLRGHDATKPWTEQAAPAVLEAYRENPDLLRSVVEHNQPMFDGLTPETIAFEHRDLPNSVLVETRKAELAAVDQRIRAAVNRREEARTSPLDSDATTKGLGQAAKDAKLRNLRLRRVSEMLDKPATDENIDLLKANLNPEYLSVLEGIRFKGEGQKLGDILRRMDESVQHAREVMPATFAERVTRDLPHHADARNGALNTKMLDQEEAAAADLYQQAGQGIKTGARKSTAFYDAEAEIKSLKAERRAAVAGLDRAENPAPTYSLNADAVRKELGPKLRHRGIETPDEIVARAKAYQENLKAGSVVGMRGNPFMVEALPFLKKASILHDMSVGVTARLNAVTGQLEDLAKIHSQMTPAERQLLARSQKAGVLPSKLVEKYPLLDRAFYGRSLDGSLKTIMSRLDDFWTREKGMFDSVFRALDRAGMLDNKTLREFKKLGYAPKSYGVHERPGLVRDDVVRGLGKKGGAGRGMESPPQLTDLSEFKMERDATQYRVRVDEPDAIVDEYFPSVVEAHRFIRQNYGQAIIDGLVEKDGIFRGKTQYRDNISVAAPLGKEGLRNLDYLGSEAVPLKRIERLQQMWRDVMMHSYVQALDLYGGMVLTDEARNALTLKGKSGLQAASQFVRVPTDQAHFGSISGKWVHKRVFAEMNNMVKTHEGLKGFMAGLQESFSHANYPVPDEIVNKVANAGNVVFDTMSKVAKMTQIIQSPRTWVGNFMFNVILDHMGQFGVYNLNNVKNLWWAIKETSPLNNKIAHDPLYVDAVNNGVLTGTFFDKNNQYIRRAWQDMVGFGTKDGIALKDLFKKREAVLRKSQLASEGKTSAAVNTQELQKELASIQAAMDTLNAGLAKRMGRFIGGFWLDGANKLGIPNNGVMDMAKKFYNQIDEHFKLAAYKNMLDSGMPKSEAIWRVKTFMQDYSRVPQSLRSSNPMLSLITSFPAELTRLGKNFLTHYPARTIGTLGAVSALNFSSMTLSGTNWDRLEAMVHARGARGWGETVKYFMTHLMSLDGDNNLAMDINTGNWLPAADITTARGAVGVGTDMLMPPEKRGLGQEILAGAVGYAGQFYLNNPLFNLGTLVAGRDQVTGERIVDEDVDFPTKVGQYMKALTQNFVSPLFPHIHAGPFNVVGRDVERVEKAIEATAAINPATGRPFRAPAGVASTLLRTISGADPRGVPVSYIDDYLGTRAPNQKRNVADDEDIIINEIKEAQRFFRNPGDTPSDQSLYSPYQELRGAYFRMIQEAKDPAAKARAEEEFVKLVHQRAESEFGAAKVTTGLTERESQQMANRISDYDPHESFGRLPIDQQAAIVTNLDRKGVADRHILEFIHRMTWSDNSMGFKGADDPEKVDSAVKTLEERVAQAGANPRFKYLLQHMKKETQPLTDQKRMLEKITGTVNQQSKEVRKQFGDRVVEILMPRK